MKGQTEKLTDAQLSKKLGGYQRTESISMLLGDTLRCVRLHPDVCEARYYPDLRSCICWCGAVPAGGEARPDEEKALLQQQLGGYFRAELTRMFGVEPAA